MDLSTICFEKVFGFTPRKAVRFFLTRIWTGYSFDAGEFAFTWVYVGMQWMSELWQYIFYGYIGFLGLVAFLITFLMGLFVLRGDESEGRLKRYKKIPYIMGYYKLTAAINAGIIFFMLFYSTDRNDPVVLALEIVTGIDMGVNLIQMAFGFAGFNNQRICVKGEQVHSHPEPVFAKPPVSTYVFKKPRK